MPNTLFLRHDVKSSFYLFDNVGRHVPNWLLEALELSGHGLLWIPLAVVMAIWPVVPWKLRICALNLTTSFVLDLIAVGACKLVVRRQRPAYAERRYNATIIADQYSFPSGHSSRCILIAGMLYVFHICPTWLVCLSMVWAVFTSLSRVLLGRHYILDILIGGILGIIVTAIMTKVRSCELARQIVCANPPAVKQLQTFHAIAGHVQSSSSVDQRTCSAGILTLDLSVHKFH